MKCVCVCSRVPTTAPCARVRAHTVVHPCACACVRLCLRARECACSYALLTVPQHQDEGRVSSRCRGLQERFSCCSKCNRVLVPASQRGHQGTKTWCTITGRFLTWWKCAYNKCSYCQQYSEGINTEIKASNAARSAYHARKGGDKSESKKHDKKKHHCGGRG